MCWVPMAMYRYLQKAYDGTPRHARIKVPRLRALLSARPEMQKCEYTEDIAAPIVSSKKESEGMRKRSHECCYGRRWRTLNA